MALYKSLVIIIIIKPTYIKQQYLIYKRLVHCTTTQHQIPLQTGWLKNSYNMNIFRFLPLSVYNVYFMRVSIIEHLLYIHKLALINDIMFRSMPAS